MICSEVVTVLFNHISRALVPGNAVEEDSDDRNDQQEVGKLAHRGTGHELQRPENEKYYRESP